MPLAAIHRFLVGSWPAAALLAVAGFAAAQPRPIDTAQSTITIHVFKTGMLSALGHDHEISAPIASGSVDAQGQKVELRVAAASLKVQDPKSGDKDREQVQANMTGPEVLDAQNFREIVFRSTAASAAGAGAWKVTGDLTLHGQTRPVTLSVREQNGHYSGTCRLNITDYGIKPIKAAGGTVRVKDEIQIDFEVQTAR